jgi:hypothetical protein
MRLREFGQTVSFEKIDVGALFLHHRNARNYLYLRVRSKALPKPTEQSAIAFVDQPVSEAPHLVLQFPERDVLVLAGAEFRLSADLADLGYARDAEAGQVVIDGEDAFLVAIERATSRLHFANLATGELIERDQDRQVYIVHRWEIVTVHGDVCTPLLTGFF